MLKPAKVSKVSELSRGAELDCGSWNPEGNYNWESSAFRIINNIKSFLAIQPNDSKPTRKYIWMLSLPICLPTSTNHGRSIPNIGKGYTTFTRYTIDNRKARIGYLKAYSLDAILYERNRSGSSSSKEK